MLTTQARYDALPVSWRKSPEPLWSVWTRKRQYGELQVHHVEEPPEMPPEGPTRQWAETPPIRVQVPFAVAVKTVPAQPRRLRQREGERGLSLLPPARRQGAYVHIELSNCILPETGAVEGWCQEIIAHFGHGYAEYHPHGPHVQILAVVDPAPYSMYFRSRTLRRTAKYAGFCWLYSPAVRVALLDEPVDLSGAALHYERPMGNARRAFEWLWDSYLAGRANGSTTPVVRDVPPHVCPPLEWPPRVPCAPMTLGRLLQRSRFQNLFGIRGEYDHGYCMGGELAYLCFRAGLTPVETTQILAAWFHTHDFDVDDWSPDYVTSLIGQARCRLAALHEEVGA